MLLSTIRPTLYVTTKNFGHNAVTFARPRGIFYESMRNVHSSTPRPQSTIQPTVLDAKEDSKPSYMRRFRVTTEVIVSKIFPAGFGWQSSSILADEYLGFAPDTVSFALTTGAGDAIGVFLGHCGYYAIKKSITGNPKILMKSERDTGILLASAAFCSGSVWQPLVNALQSAELSFQGVFTGTWLGCASAFYLGLRAARTVLPRFLDNVEEPTYDNSKTDAALSISIGGATGFFVGTDVGYLPHQNFLIDVVGITKATSKLGGCVIAGSSTSLGFGAAQTALNISYPKDKCWND